MTQIYRTRTLEDETGCYVILPEEFAFEIGVEVLVEQIGDMIKIRPADADI